jgi:hypothetical protein
MGTILESDNAAAFMDEINRLAKALGGTIITREEMMSTQRVTQVEQATGKSGKPYWKVSCDNGVKATGFDAVVVGDLVTLAPNASGFMGFKKAQQGDMYSQNPPVSSPPWEQPVQQEAPPLPLAQPPIAPDGVNRAVPADWVLGYKQGFANGFTSGWSAKGVH